ncbi:MAG: preprotein translocase subunit SecG [Candidatus Nomurabacteria bacterium]|jgi:preprotein translocase subunit SecG|nr:preprotein translocase subunit SecG [Candidatus Nomurabacteria bacterium]
METFLRTTMIISASLSIILILLQQRGASLGAGLGSSGELNTKRRGLEKSLFNATLVMAAIFILSIVAEFFVPIV